MYEERVGYRNKPRNTTAISEHQNTGNDKKRLGFTVPFSTNTFMKENTEFT